MGQLMQSQKEGQSSNWGNISLPEMFVEAFRKQGEQKIAK